MPPGGLSLALLSDTRRLTEIGNLRLAAAILSSSSAAASILFAPTSLLTRNSLTRSSLCSHRLGWQNSQPGHRKQGLTQGERLRTVPVSCVDQAFRNARISTSSSDAILSRLKPEQKGIVRRCVHVDTTMNETLSIRIDPKTKKRLDALSKRSKRSKSFLAAEAIAAYVDSEEWQLGEVQAGMAELDRDQAVSHEKVAKWFKSWGKPSETKAPR